MKYTLPALRKLAKRGSNAKLLEWLEGYSQIFYQKGLSAGIRTGTMDVLKSLSDIADTELRREIDETIGELNEIINDSTNNGGKQLESESDQLIESSGSDTDDTNSSEGSPEAARDNPSDA
jgi:hypothetical protein